MKGDSSQRLNILNGMHLQAATVECVVVCSDLLISRQCADV